MKQYLVSVYHPEGPVPPPEALAPVTAELDKIHADLKAARAWVFAGGLHAPDTATVLRAKDGDVLITDGPFAEGKEYLGGFTILEAADLDSALVWARRFARALAPLSVEVRPFLGEP